MANSIQKILFYLRGSIKSILSRNLWFRQKNDENYRTQINVNVINLVYGYQYLIAVTFIVTLSKRYAET
jgi:hypothetical protein